MKRALIIFRSDSWNTRKIKKSIRRKINRKKRQQQHFFGIEGEKAIERSYVKSNVIYSNDIESFCEDNHLRKWKPNDNSVINLDESFSLFQEPNNVFITLLNMLFNAKISNKISVLRYKGKVSFGALYLLDNFCWEIARRRQWRLLIKDITENEKDKLSKLRSVVSSTYESESAHMINERVRISRLTASSNQAYRERSKQITDMVQLAIRDCTKNQLFELSFDAYRAINSTIGEHFDNIYNHASASETGVLCGFYDKEYKEVTILIYNFGKTIYETLVSDDLPSEMKNQIEQVIKNHVSREYFLAKRKFSQENALTLLALQEGISSFVKYDKSRGHGLIDFIDNCFNLNKGTKIVIISGKTAIRIDNKYRISNRVVFERERKILAFNDANDIFEQPDQDYIINMNIKFPGVLIETTIPLDY
jgi:hypothetical protein